MLCTDCESDVDMEEVVDFEPGAETVEVIFECMDCRKVWHGTLYSGRYAGSLDEVD